MATLAGVAYWPADTSEPVLELTTGGPVARGCRCRRGAERPARWFGVTKLPLTGSGKIQKFRLREQINSAELKDLPTGQVQAQGAPVRRCPWPTG